MDYIPEYLDNIDHISDHKFNRIKELNEIYTLNMLKSSKNLETLGIDFIHASALIEGNTYDQFDTETLLLAGQTAGGKPYSDARMILNLREAFNLIVKDDYTIDRTFIFNLHSTIADGELSRDQLGVVRDEPVAISGTNYRPPYGRQYLDAEFRYILSQSKNCKSTVDRAIYLHLNMAYLQYFRDGNKRTARMVQNAVLFREGLVPLFFTKDSVKEYRKSLINYYETGDSANYVEWFITNYELMYERLNPPNMDSQIRSFTK